MIARMAVRLARSSGPEHRWRRVAVPLSAAVFVLLLLAGTSVVAMVQREAERVEQRTALIAAKPSDTDLNIAWGDDVWRAQQFLVVWVQPAGEGDTVLPPGMSKLPEPGQAAVSPALDSLAARYPSLAERYPDRRVLGMEGVQSGDELLAYVRMPEGRKLSGKLSGELSGVNPALRIGVFGPSSRAGVPFGLEPLTLTATVDEAVGGVLGFIVMPGLIVLVVGLAAASVSRDRRFEVMRWIGAPAGILTALSALETLLLAAPGIVGAALLWGLAAPRLERVPLVGHQAVRGDLALPWWLSLAILGIAVLSIGFVAILVSAVATSRRSSGAGGGPRPTRMQPAVSPLRVAPLGFALGLLAIGWPARGPAGGMLNLAGTVAAVIGVALVFPNVLKAIGACVARRGPLYAQIAGRSLEWDSLRAARPFLGIGAIMVVSLTSAGYTALARYYEAAEPMPSRGTQAVSVEWLDPRSEDPAKLANALDSGLTVPYDVGGHEEHGNSHGHGNSLVVGATCQQLAPYFAGQRCSPDAPYGLPSGLEQEVASKLAFAGERPGAEVRLVAANEVASTGGALVLDEGRPLGTLETRVREAAMRQLPAPYVTSPLASTSEVSPIVDWLVGGIAFAVVVLTIGCLVSLVDRLVSTRHHRRRLSGFGLSRRQLMALEAWQFAVPYSAVVVLGSFVGLLVCAFTIGISPTTPVPWSGIGLIIVAAVFVGAFGTCCAAFFGTLNGRNTPKQKGVAGEPQSDGTRRSEAAEAADTVDAERRERSVQT